MINSESIGVSDDVSDFDGVTDSVFVAVVDSDSDKFVISVSVI